MARSMPSRTVSSWLWHLAYLWPIHRLQRLPLRCTNNPSEFLRPCVGGDLWTIADSLASQAPHCSNNSKLVQQQAGVGVGASIDRSIGGIRALINLALTICKNAASKLLTAPSPRSWLPSIMQSSQFLVCSLIPQRGLWQIVRIIYSPWSVIW